MNIQRGYIRLFRQFEDWEWYDNPFTKAIFTHCLIKANNKAKKWRDLTVKRGQFVTSYEKLAASNGMTIQQTRTALKQLQSTNEIEYKTTNLYTLITVKNFNLYQSFEPTNKQNEGQVTQSKRSDNKGNAHVAEYSTNKQNGEQVTTTNNNIYNTKEYIYLSSSIEKNSKNEISDDEREILKKYLKKNNPNIKNIRAYLKKVIENGDYKDILKEEKAKLEKEDKSNIKDDIKKVRDERSAIRFLAKYGNQLSDVQLPEVEKIMKEYNFDSFDDVVKASYRYKE